MTGRLVGVVGPSGVGKDTVMQALADSRPDINLVRRVITRDPELGGEDYDPVTEAEFERLVEEHSFCLHWRAHGLCYGIPGEVRGQVQSGQTLLVNLSRSVLEEAASVFADFVVLNLIARPETLAARLAGRGRETEAGIAERLKRVSRPLPVGIDIISIANDGPLDQTVSAALRALHPVRA